MTLPEYFLRPAKQNNEMFRSLEAEMDYFMHTREKVRQKDKEMEEYLDMLRDPMPNMRTSPRFVDEELSV